MAQEPQAYLDLLRLADTLLQRNEPGDREKFRPLKFRPLLDESLAISSELGITNSTISGSSPQ